LGVPDLMMLYFIISIGYPASLALRRSARQTPSAIVYYDETKIHEQQKVIQFFYELRAKRYRRTRSRV
jgi:hypothetical protein